MNTYICEVMSINFDMGQEDQGTGLKGKAELPHKKYLLLQNDNYLHTNISTTQDI